MNDFPIMRFIHPGTYRIEEVFPRIGHCAILTEMFGGPEAIIDVLERTEVHIIDLPHEMYVSNDDGSVAVGLSYLRNAPNEYLYLDIVHELCHVKQHLAGRNLYDRTKSYVDRETEIEAYRITVQEARHIGLSEANIANYLRVSWITDEEHQRLLSHLGVKALPD